MSVSYGYVVGFKFEDIGGTIEEVTTSITKYNEDTGAPYDIEKVERRFKLGNQTVEHSSEFQTDLNFCVTNPWSKYYKEYYIGKLIYLDDNQIINMGLITAELIMQLNKDFGISHVETSKIFIFPYASQEW